MKKTKKNCSTGGDLLGSLNTINPLVGVGINALMNTAQKYMEEVRNRNMVVSGTPGNFNNGGPIDSLYQPVITNPITTNVTPTTQPLMPTAAGLVNPNIGLNTPGANWGSSKSKSKERFREKYTGGVLPISSDSVQIKGAPNKVDGNSFPQIQANLDHNEVLKNNFVFSNRLKDDITSSPFAKLALLIEKGTANAEKVLKVNPSDQFAKNAIRLNNQNLENVAKRQEQKAQALGLRGDSNGYQNGGPITPNWQSLGNIRFDSNEARQDPQGFLIVKDVNSNKDYGVIRNEDGSYAWYNPKITQVEASKDNAAQRFYQDFINSPFYKLRHVPFSDSLEVEKHYKKFEGSSSMDRLKEEDLKELANFEGLRKAQNYQLKRLPTFVADYPEGSAYRSKDFLERDYSGTFIQIDPKQYEEFGGFDDIMAHELNHAKDDILKNYIRDNRAYSFFDQYGTTAPTKYQKTEFTNEHDASGDEYKSDLNAARFLLKQAGVFDFTSPQLKNLKDKDADAIIKAMTSHPDLKDKELIKRLFRNSKDTKSLKEALKSFVVVTPKTNMRNAQNGGPIEPWYKFAGDDSGTYWNPIDPTTGRPRNQRTVDYFSGYTPQNNGSLIDLGVDSSYYDPTTKQVVMRNQKGNYVPLVQNRFKVDSSGNIIDSASGKTINNISRHLNYLNAPRVGQGETTSTTSTNPNSPQQSPVTTQQPPFDNTDYINRLEKELADFKASRSKKKPSSPAAASKQPNLRNAQAEYEARSSFQMNPDQAKYEYGVEPLAPLNMLSRNMMVLGPGEMNVSAPVQVQSTNPTSITPKQLEALKSISTTAVKPKGNKGLMLGDFLQMSEVLSKFGQLAGGSEVERPYYDNTRITKNSYDPSQALNQNTRSYSTAVRNLDSQSINARRALAGSLLGSKMSADAQTLTQYQQMNQAANTDYENRTSNQRRFNIGQSLQTNDMNARNRAAYKEAIDVAFNSLGNFGQALNRKQTAQDQLGILATIYPDVYARIINSMYNGNQ